MNDLFGFRTPKNPSTTTGWFVYFESPDQWLNAFTVEDDDGMTFALDTLKHFHGKHVRITIELVKCDSTLRDGTHQRDLERAEMVAKL